MNTDHPDDRDEVEISLLQSAHDLTPWVHEYRVKSADGCLRWMMGNSLARRQADGTEHGPAMRQIRDIAAAVERAIQSVRSLTAQLWPPVLYKFGLGAALEWLVLEMETNNGLSLSLQSVSGYWHCPLTWTGTSSSACSTCTTLRD